MSLVVTKSGILTTVQDLGRLGSRRFGINPGGAMDRQALRLVNALLANPPSAAALELHFPAGEYLFEKEAAFAVGGADLSASISGRKVPNWSAETALPGDVLKFERKLSGHCAYLAIAGGFVVDDWLSSSSTNLAAAIGGFDGRRLVAGDRIEFRDGPSVFAGLRLGRSIVPHYSKSPGIRVTRGPEFELLTAASAAQLFESSFRVSADSNRMGFRLSGPRLYSLTSDELLSSGTTFGTIQLLPNGQLIVLMADHQTTGGYPRIAVAAEVDLSLLGQLGSGDELSFDLISIGEAERLYENAERDLSILRLGVELRGIAKL